MLRGDEGRQGGEARKLVKSKRIARFSEILEPKTGDRQRAALGRSHPLPLPLPRTLPIQALS